MKKAIALATAVLLLLSVATSVLRQVNPWYEVFAKSR